ncbi:SMI1/KNR4 family protein [Thermoflexibacter ruber]|uniref:SMI1 / KNR4 family (SUKH-1) n=1 Tax=Thermoflexibacter ruber TaxID=1003 RepID=A0A1I2K8Y5_9BACT|nr:hypothetical protein [Thermoflexibacter ruber]SFF62758.1 hypothetical protein SAMN04488541_10917 [Thermoflexibacter ruber]
MKKILEQIKDLSLQYPHKVTLYPPADNALIKSYEKLLNVVFDEQLLQLYLFSNGISLMDYCISGFKNRKLIDFFNLNYSLWEGNLLLKEKFISFMITSKGDNFGLIYESNQKTYVVGYINNIYSQDYLIVGNSIEDFFTKFLHKISYILSVNEKDNYIEYIDDEFLPIDIRSWQ